MLLLVGWLIDCNKQIPSSSSSSLSLMSKQKKWLIEHCHIWSVTNQISKIKVWLDRGEQKKSCQFDWYQFQKFDHEFWIQSFVLPVLLSGLFVIIIISQPTTTKKLINCTRKSFPSLCNKIHFVSSWKNDNFKLHLLLLLLLHGPFNILQTLMWEREREREREWIISM